MKYVFVILTLLCPLLLGTACDNESTLPGNNEAQNNIDENDDLMKDKIRIKVEDEVFTATLLDNATTSAFTALLPLTITMTELNGNEKYFRFSNNLPTNASNPGFINSGDLMLWGSNTLVLFYETFSTSHSYTKLGKIDNPTGLAAALGTGNVSVTIEIE